MKAASNKKNVATVPPPPVQLEINFDKQTYTRAEVIHLLKQVYMEAAYSYSDYGRYPWDFEIPAENFVKEYMKER